MCVCVYCKTLKFHSTPLLYKLWTTVAVKTIIFDTNLIGDQFEDPVESNGIEDGGVGVAGSVWI